MIHTFSMHGRPIVLDVHSGSVHMPDELAFQMLQMREAGLTPQTIRHALADSYPANVLDETESEITALTEQGLLFTNDQPEQATAYMQNRRPVIKALCLHVAHACNLRCKYCFAGQGEYHGTGALMDADTGKRAIDFLIAHSGRRKNLEVDFFGGEPTLNVETVKAIVAYARAQETASGKNFRFTLTTNGLRINDDLIAYCNAHMDNVVLSLDGRREINDHMRVRPDGSGCYDAIVPQFLRWAESRNQTGYYIRGTYTRNNLDFCEDVLHLATLGFKQISVEPVVADPAQAYAIRPEDVPYLCEQYERLAAEMARRMSENKACFNFFHFMLDLTGGPCVAKRITGCGAGTEYLAVTPSGELYPCHQFVGETDFCIGHLETGITHTAQCDRFAQCHVYAKPECTRCWAKYFCSGGCAANAYHRHKDILSPDEIGCALQKKRIECALYLKAMAALLAN